MACTWLLCVGLSSFLIDSISLGVKRAETLRELNMPVVEDSMVYSV
jgi:hypothetical protein